MTYALRIARQPVVFPDMERLALGDALHAVANTNGVPVSPADYADPTHAAFAVAIISHGDMRPRLDLEAVAAAAAVEWAGVADVGGADYLRCLAALRAEASSDAVRHAKFMVWDAADRRRLLEAGNELNALLNGAEPDDAVFSVSQREQLLRARINHLAWRVYERETAHREGTHSARIDWECLHMAIRRIVNT